MNLKKLIFFISLSLLFFVGCENNKPPTTEPTVEHEIWINTTAECCGVKDPLSNLKWLREKSIFDEQNEKPQYDYNHILVFKNNETLKEYIVVNTFFLTSWVTIYDCDGNEIDGGAYRLQNYFKKNNHVNNVKFEPPMPCKTCEEFFRTHTLIDTIAYHFVEH